MKYRALLQCIFSCALLAAVGLNFSMQQAPAVAEPLCQICFIHEPNVALHCGHHYCVDCLRQHIRAAGEVVGIAAMRCPTLDCRQQTDRWRFTTY